MERQLWPKLYPLLMQAGKHHCRRGKQFSDAWIAVIYMWSVIHGRPISWACDIGNWRGESTAPMNLPSPSTMSRRPNGKKSLGVRQLLEQAQQITTDWFPGAVLLLIRFQAADRLRCEQGSRCTLWPRSRMQGKGLSPARAA